MEAPQRVTAGTKSLSHEEISEDLRNTTIRKKI